MMVSALVLVEVTAGITEASMTYSPSSPRIRNPPTMGALVRSLICDLDPFELATAALEAAQAGRCYPPLSA